MTDNAIERRTFGCLAQLLEYPRPGLIEAARECQALMSPTCPEAAALLHQFCACAEQASPGDMEEAYTATFDLDAACQPYVGYHLFGETYKRSVFLLELKQRFLARGFVVKTELPDHMGVMLHFLEICDDAAMAEELVGEALLPALERMIGKSEEAEAGAEGDGRHAHPTDRMVYLLPLRAARLVLQQRQRTIKTQRRNRVQSLVGQ